MEKQIRKSIYLSIVIPALNEENRLPKTLASTIKFLNEQPYESEIIVVCDGSTDTTKEVAESFSGQYPSIWTMENYPNRGKGYAVKSGMLAAKGEYRLYMDADYSVPIEFLTTFLSMMNHNYDIVIGSRGLRKSQIQRHQPLLRELGGKSFGVLQRMVIDLPFSDTQCGFKLFTKGATENLFPKIVFDCAYFDAELLYIAYHSKMEIGEIGVRWHHDGETRLPIGVSRTIDLVKKLFSIKRLHNNNLR